MPEILQSKRDLRWQFGRKNCSHLTKDENEHVAIISWFTHGSAVKIPKVTIVRGILQELTGFLLRRTHL